MGCLVVILWVRSQGALLSFIAVIFLSFCLRLFLLIKADWMADYDESVIGLMAIHVLQGGRPLFFAGQPYLGAVDAYLAAALFSFLGVDRVPLKLVPLGFSIVWVATTILLARRLFGPLDRRGSAGHAAPTAGLIAGLVAACAPFYILDVTLKAGIGVVQTMAFGNLLWLSALALAGSRRRRTALFWACALGFVTGVAFWVHWLIAYYLAAAAGFLALRYLPALLRRTPGQAAGGPDGPEPIPPLRLPPAAVPAALVAFLLGSAPFWLYNLRAEWVTFHYFWDIALQGSPGVSRALLLLDWLTIFVPRALGLTVPGLPWLPAVTAAPSLAALLLLCVRVAGPWMRTGEAPFRLLALFVVSMPVLYVFSGFGSAAFAFHEAGVDATGRYVAPLFAAVPLAVAFIHQQVSRLAGLGTLATVVFVSLAGVWGAPPHEIFQSPYYNRAPASLTGVIDALDGAGVRHVWTDVGLAHPLMFQSAGRIRAADFLDRSNGGVVRFPEAYQAVEDAPRTAYLVPVMSGVAGPLEREFLRIGVPYDKAQIGGLALFVPATTVGPEDVRAGLGYQY